VTSKFSTSRGARFLKLGALSGKVGSSYLGRAVKGAFLDAESRAQELLDTNVTNALRVARTFGELKGAVMKVGQMLSLQEDLLPAEMREVLRGLQSHAPPVAFSVLRPVLEAELGPDVRGDLVEISETALASASIGQVHRATLRDGSRVVLKIQYPGVEAMVESDLRNLRLFARSVGVAAGLRADITKFLAEARSRLIEELDYRLEAQNLQEFRAGFADDPRYVVPRPHLELCSKRVLVSDYEPGLTGDQLCAAEVPQSLRNQAGEALCDVVLRQICELGALQADPNLANFAFRPDGRVVLYDFGCVKRFPPAFVAGLKQVARDALAGHYAALRGDLAALGYLDLGRMRLPVSVYRAYADTVCAAWRRPGDFDFGTTRLRAEVIELHRQHWRKFLDYDAPADALFLGRALGGMFGNLVKLRASVNMHGLLEKYLG